MKEELQYYRSLSSLAPSTYEYYIDLDNQVFVYRTMITKEIYDYFNKDKNNLTEYLNDYTISENTIYDRDILDENCFRVVYKETNWYLEVPEDDRYNSVMNHYNIDVSLDIVSYSTQCEFLYKWLQVSYRIDKFDIYEGDLKHV